MLKHSSMDCSQCIFVCERACHDEPLYVSSIAVGLCCCQPLYCQQPLGLQLEE
jgi:hypothetical protein